MASSSSSSSSTPWSSYFENSDEITQDGKVLIKLSDRKPLFIVPDVFREKVYINIREYYLNKREEEEEEEEEEDDDDEVRLRSGRHRLWLHRRRVLLPIGKNA